MIAELLLRETVFSSHAPISVRVVLELLLSYESANALEPEAAYSLYAGVRKFCACKAA